MNETGKKSNLFISLYGLNAPQHKYYNRGGELMTDPDLLMCRYVKDSNGFLHSFNGAPAITTSGIYSIVGDMYFYHGIEITKHELNLRLNRDKMLNEL